LREAKFTAVREVGPVPRSLPRPLIGMTSDVTMQSGFHDDDAEAVRAAMT